jgi:hypothetical protein
MFGFTTTADEVIDGIDLSGKTAVVTGASSGLGLQTVATLSRLAKSSGIASIPATGSRN